MQRFVLFAVALAAVIAPARAADAPPEVQAVTRLAQECGTREFNVYLLQAKLAAETARADAAEAKLREAEPSADHR